ncbi:hypothetical protein COW53_07440 [bacterium CG17_big_fil_post_rev_8_21_14_2_50_64_8]|nr:MAG: hypothetical protein COW53_07440 [bacterium CG17_big_fil_post_rev_8_21_14_2_50_64_8]PJA74119.1 MAG: hypothetical protein CO151_10710 [bacterium CG_4_9_14_3_um_filter_65_15]
MPDGIHVLDGSYVLDVGNLHVNITNHGLIGSQYSLQLPYSKAPSGEWPGGSGKEYLWGAGLWIGGIVDGQISVVTGQPERELRPGESIFETIYEAKAGRQTRPVANEERTGVRLPDVGADDDRDGKIDEDFLNGLDDDGDGRIDEDFGQIASQMFTCTMHDDLPLIRELYPDHLPMGLTVVQRAAAYEQQDYRDMILLDYRITNTTGKTIRDAYVGMYVDCDIQERDGRGSNADDLGGFYRGAVRGEDGTFYRLLIGWMKDTPSVDALPGVFGTVMLGHDTDPFNFYSPHVPLVNSFQIFSANATGNQGGIPVSDEERYHMMSLNRIDRDRTPENTGELKLMFSSGPFPNVVPGRTITYRVAMVIGDGMDGMLRNARKAAELYRGRYLDVDDNPYTGRYGRETMVCIEDSPTWEDGQSRIYGRFAVFLDNTCFDDDQVYPYRRITMDDLVTQGDGRNCIWVNADNCDECFRLLGEECNRDNSEWTTMLASPHTGVNGRETHVPWVFTGVEAPLPPHLRLMPGDNAVEVFWDDISEYDIDLQYQQVDFESYRVWRVAEWTPPPGATDSTEPEASLWTMLVEYDLVDFVPIGVVGNATELPVGRNSGLDIARYTPACLSDPRFAGLAEVMQTFVDADSAGRNVERPRIRSRRGSVIPGREVFLPWEYAPDVLDTFFAVTTREGSPPPDEVVPKRATRYYHYRDNQVHNGFQTFYSVVATDRKLVNNGSGYQIAGMGIQSDPGNNSASTTPAPEAQTSEQREKMGANIYVYPNPATQSALAEFQQRPGTASDPSGVRVIFNNLPAAHNTIRIFTSSGDLIQTINHDGLRDGGAASWNLMTRNNQEVVSGIYLYSVHSDDSRFETFRGYFTVVR